MDEIVKAILSIPGTKKISVSLLVTVLIFAAIYFYYLEQERIKDKAYLSTTLNNIQNTVEEFKADVFALKIINARMEILMDTLKEKNQDIEKRILGLESRINVK